MTDPEKPPLDRVYEIDDPEEMRALYNAWSDDYDTDLAAQGYATPARLAAALAAHVPWRDRPVLDYGCGTGLSGGALAAEGFTTLHGLDVAPEMLAKARARGLYSSLTTLAPADPPPFAPGDYAAVIAAGVISHGAAPPELIGAITARLAPGALFGLSFNDHTLEDTAYTGALEAELSAGTLRLLSQEHGPHLPGININSTVYLLAKT